MRKNVAKIISVALCACTACVAVVFGTQAHKSVATANEAKLVYGEEWKTSYTVGEAFVAPVAQIEVGGKKYDAECAIVFPDGNYHSEREISLSMLGKYTLVYTVNVNGKKIEKTASFETKQNLYEVSSSSSSLTFVNELALSTDTTSSGMHVSLADGDSFRYNEPIDLMQNNGSRYEVFTFYPYGASQIAGDGKSVEVESFIVTLTDCYDESNYIEFEISYTSNNAGSYYPYYLAGSAKQVHAGLEISPITAVSGNRKEVYIDGARYIAKFGDDFGVTAGAKNADGLAYTLSFDALENRVYLEDNQLRLISDLDNADIYGKDKLFTGFTTGEVYLSVRGENYVGRSMRFDIASLDGNTGSALKNSLQSDTKPPVIEVDFNGAIAENIKIAKGEAVRVFEAQSYDVNAVGGVKTSVYYNYGTQRETQVALKAGKFTPTAVGVYTVVYTAKDRAGNMQTETVTLNCVEAEKGISLKVDKITALSAGEDSTLPEHTLTGVNEGVRLGIYACFDGEKRVEIDSDTRTFFPPYIGEYEVVYEYSDGLYSYEYAYKVESKASEAVRFLDEPSLPLYFIKNAQYSVPSAQAYTFTESAPVAKQAECYISADMGEYKKVEGKHFVVDATNNVRLKYAYGGVEYITPAVPVVDVGFGNALNLPAYFQGDFEKNAVMKGISYTANTTTGEASIQYILPVSLGQFSLEFEIPKEASNFEAVCITLTDYENRQKSVSLRYVNEGLKTKLFIGDNAGVTLAKSFVSGYKIFYSKDSQTFIEDTGVNCVYPVDFETDRVLLSVRLEGMYGQSAIVMQNINGQPFKQMDEDGIRPTHDVVTPKGQYARNTRITVGAMLASDVLSPVLDEHMLVTVLAPDETPVTSVDGVILSNVSALRAYEIDLTQVGKYVVKYYAKDQNGNERTTPHNVHVFEDDSPEITLDDNYNENTVITVKTGTRVQTAGYTAQEGVTVHVRVVSPYGGLFEVDEKGTFVASIAGKWQVLYYAVGENGNVTLRYYTVVVE